ncbi:MAG: hypothetical protein A3I68_05830 [Candidatus Melainabacteria bacterium RIFCSPLOWO2_02_FULL_35_15]|nr:MAG: hypothetical protein A3F80_05115 [Candidatus Melainabacteria bacterium RIFCSPLOWO2_12_FULL_35_11]OGI13887.1 MAG: hypothetical protein A3I68_05830 [Candidatus Melainabacteria bacterium RIFCSPLOWO2_02_FULL_35_15]
MQKMLPGKSFNFAISLLLTLLLVFIFVPFSFAQNVKSNNRFIFDSLPLNLEEITNSADRVFAGTCEKIEEIEKDPLSNLRIVKYTFKVLEAIKGVSTDEITFTQWKPTTVEAPYVTGEKYVMFLYPNSRLGLTSPVGYMQGKFLVEKAGANRGVELIRNRLNNVGLSKNLRTQKRISINTDKFLNDYIQECSEAGKPIKYRDFIRAVRYLSNK